MKYKLEIDDVTQITTFLKKFSIVDSNLLLVFTPELIKAATHTPEKSVVKLASMKLNEVFSKFPDNIPSIIKIGIFQIDKVAQAFKFFNGKIDFIIETEIVDGDEIGVSIVLESALLRIKFDTSPMSLFTYISDEMFSTISNTNDSLMTFQFNKDQQAKVSSLFAVDIDYSKITFYIKNSKLYVKGKNFNYLLDNNEQGNDYESSIFKHHYAFVDRELSNVFVCEDKIIIKSSETDTTIVIGQAT